MIIWFFLVLGPSPGGSIRARLPLLSYLCTFHHKHVLGRILLLVPPPAGQSPPGRGLRSLPGVPSRRWQLTTLQDPAAFPVAKPHRGVCWAPGWASDWLLLTVLLSIPGGNRLLIRRGRTHSFTEHCSMHWRTVSAPGLRAQCQEHLPGIGTSQNVILPSRGTDVPPHPHPVSCKPPD